MAAALPGRRLYRHLQVKARDLDYNGFNFYWPNTSNGLAVASWQTIWVQNLSKPLQGYQTIIMVRREHDLSGVGSAPWQALNPLIGVGSYGDKLFSTDAAKALQKSDVSINGAKVDPMTVAMPTDFHIATYAFDQVMDLAFRSSDGQWEGAVAECLVLDGKLSENKRRGVEEYLRRKWLSAVDLTLVRKEGREKR